MSAPAIRDQRFWLVGASSGIGAALARELVARGAQVAVSARRADRLAELADGRMIPVSLDATDRDAVRAAAAQVSEALGGLDVVVWCAGYWQQFDARHWDADVFARHVEVNLMGLNNVLAAVVEPMARARHGHIVGIASVAGYRGLAGAEAYGATKAAQINLLEGLRAALASSGVRVTTVCPGFVRTEMTETNDFPMPFLIDADDAAKAIADGLESRRTEIVFPLPMAVLMKTARILPVRIWTLLSARRTGAPQASTKPSGTGPSDPGLSDPGLSDPGLSDTGLSDPGLSDTGLPDPGLSDTGLPDTGLPDTGLPDTGLSDTGLSDTGLSDTGRVGAEVAGAQRPGAAPDTA